MKIIGIEANCYDGENGHGVEVLARFTDKDGEELTACVSDYGTNWYACVGRGFMKAGDDPCEETICDFTDSIYAIASEYGKLFAAMTELASTVRQIG